ncbi:hypothetical protein [Thermococcus onnurineus]|uniref:hypothetical protein n=1 Tax=Thermococcus onnurineus TaxID=342948 RepID=UPI0011D09D43|nr:hypothetical protein [Thermococcus onnurineus]
MGTVTQTLADAHDTTGGEIEINQRRIPATVDDPNVIKMPFGCPGGTLFRFQYEWWPSSTIMLKKCSSLTLSGTILIK